MPVELKDKYPFSVDTWSLLSQRKEHHFLTHAHSDHTSGIESFARRRIYCSDTTRRLLLRRFPKLEYTVFVILEVGDTKLVLDDEASFTVAAFDANHCPGALMLLFEGNFGNVLHTGDCRLTDGCLKNILGKYKAQQCVLDCVFLDCTFGKELIRMPSKQEAFQQVQQCILNHPKAPIVYLACDLLGQEDLLSDIVSYFRSKIFVDKNLLPDYYADMKLLIPELLTEDPQSTRFHVCEGFPKLYERAKVKFMQAHRLKQEEPLFIRPSAQWYTYGERLQGAGWGMILEVALKRPTAQRHRTLPAPKAAEKDQYGIWHVCHSAHSSRAELERAMEALWPKEVISTTPHCHAKEVMSERPGLYHIDVNSRAMVESPRACREVTNFVGEQLKDAAVSQGLTEVLYTRSLTSSQRKKVLFDPTSNGNIGGESLENVVPLFGTARYSIPSSPPMSFSSADSQVDSQATELYFSDDAEEDTACKPAIDFQATELYFSDDAEEGTACKPVVLEKSSNLNLEHVDEVAKKVDVEAVAKSRCQVNSPEFFGTGTQLISGNFSQGVAKSTCRANSLDEFSGTGTPLIAGNSSQEYPEVRKTEDDSFAKPELKTSRHVSPRTRKRKGGVSGVLEESTRKLYRAFHVPIPAPLPSLLDLYHFDV